MVYNDFDPRKIEIMLPGSNPVLEKNTQREMVHFQRLREEGRTVPEFQVAWTSRDLSLVVGTCEYLRDHLPASAFRLETIPGFQIFPEPDCLAIGATGPVCGSYYAIRPGPTGLYDVSVLSDREGEVGGMAAYNRFEDALKQIVFDWLVSIGRILNYEVFSPEMCPEGVEMVPHEWRIHKELFTLEQQRYVEEMEQAYRASKGLSLSPEDILNGIDGKWVLYRSTFNKDAWYVGYDSRYFKNLTYGLNADIFTFMDRIAVAIAERKSNR